LNKRILIYAYARMNLGDDLFIKILCGRYPETNFFVMCSKDSSAALNGISNLYVIPGGDDIVQKSISASCDAIVNIGGSIFMENDKWEDKFNQYIKRMMGNKPYYIIGSNFGPYKSVSYFKSYKSVFKSAEDICFREMYSYKLFSDLPNARYAPDVAFSYKTVKFIDQKKQIIVSVIDLSNRGKLKEYEKIYTDKIIEISRYFVQKGYAVSLMGFCEYEGDKKAIGQLLSRLNHEERKSILPYYYAGDIEDALKLIQESQYIIATRFHAMILGWVFHKPVYPLVYSDKSLHVMEDIGYKGKYTTISGIYELNADETYEYLIKSGPVNIEQQVYTADLQFEMLDKLLLK